MQALVVIVDFPEDFFRAMRERAEIMFVVGIIALVECVKCPHPLNDLGDILSRIYALGQYDNAAHQCRAKAIIQCAYCVVITHAAPGMQKLPGGRNLSPLGIKENAGWGCL